MRNAIIAHYLGEHRSELPADAKGLKTYIARIAKATGFTLSDSEIKRLVKEFEKFPKQPDTDIHTDETNNGSE